MCLVMRAYLDSQEKVCSQISVSTYNVIINNHNLHVHNDMD